MVTRTYVPDAGDIVWLEFDPQARREQSGHRPALVISPASYNGKTNLMLCCPMTMQIKGYPFEVVIASSKNSAVLADQLKNLDWRVRCAKKKVQSVLKSCNMFGRRLLCWWDWGEIDGV